MSSPYRLKLQEAIEAKGFENWRPSTDVPHLVRPRHRPTNLPGEGRKAAVMILMFQREHETRLLLTRRQPDLRKHGGQIAFPGGRQDPGETLLATSLRETHEEVGVAPELVHVVGQIGQIYIPPTDFTVVPFVGWHDGPPKFLANEMEVAELIEAPLDHLMDPTTLTQGPVTTHDGETLIVPFYAVQHHRVWGATAIMLSELLERLRAVS